MGQLSRLDAHPAESEVCNFEVPFLVNHYILGLDVPVNDVLSMQVLEAQQNLDEAVSGILLAHSLDSSQVEEELTAGAICIRSNIHSRASATKCLVSNAN